MLVLKRGIRIHPALCEYAFLDDDTMVNPCRFHILSLFCVRFFVCVWFVSRGAPVLWPLNLQQLGSRFQIGGQDEKTRGLCQVPEIPDSA